MGLDAERVAGDRIRIMITDGRSTFDTIETDEDVKAFVDKVDEVLATADVPAEPAATDEAATEVAPEPPKV